MKFLALLGSAAMMQAATLSITPSILYNCVGLHGRATLTWNGVTAPVRIEVGPQRVPMTGFNDAPSGSVETGEWVSDGLQFSLVNEAGGVESIVVGRVQCGGRPPALSTESYYPLATGNTWVYRANSRNVTSDYVTQTVGTSVVEGGRSYFPILTYAGGTRTTAMLVRAAEDGRIFRYAGAGAGEELWLDPSLLPKRTFTGPLGTFPDAVVLTATGGNLIREDRIFVRGIGLAGTRADMITGSSGGFSSSLELVEVRLAGGIHLEIPAPRLSLAAENLRLDVTGRKVTNCAVPCYFVACGFVPGADPPNTYKPCTQARVQASAGGDFLTQLELLNAAGAVVARAVDAPAPPGETLRYVQVPLYSAPNQPLPPGEYRLLGKMLIENREAARTELKIQIE